MCNGELDCIDLAHGFNKTKKLAIHTDEYQCFILFSGNLFCTALCNFIKTKNLSLMETGEIVVK